MWNGRMLMSHCKFQLIFVCVCEANNTWTNAFLRLSLLKGQFKVKTCCLFVIMLVTFLYKHTWQTRYWGHQKGWMSLVDGVIMLTAYLSASCSLYKSLQATAAPPETRDVYKKHSSWLIPHRYECDSSAGCCKLFLMAWDKYSKLLL